MLSMTHHLDICIRGGGIVGHALALLLARDRLRIGLVAPQSAAQGEPDVRAYALNAKSKALLESVRCWPDALHATTNANIKMMCHGKHCRRTHLAYRLTAKKSHRIHSAACFLRRSMP
jgi:2-polyprenyl-6-methoxyphenol hydroxylase-like FAD-dependent oxidoreductase